MKHTHKFEAISHHSVSPEVMDCGIQSAETRKCTKCEKQAIFVLTKKGQWVPLFEERKTGEKDILMA